MVWSEIRQIIQGLRRPAIIGISGLNGAGKTHFSLELKTRINNIIVIHQDDFRYPLSLRKQCTPQMYYEHWFDYHKIISELLTPIRHGWVGTKKLAVYDKQTGKYAQEKTYVITHGCIVVYDGLFSFRKEFLPLYDLRIFLKADEKVALSRLSLRDIQNESQETINHKWHTRSLPAFGLYQKDVMPEAIADVVVDTTKDYRIIRFK